MKSLVFQKISCRKFSSYGKRPPERSRNPFLMFFGALESWRVLLFIFSIFDFRNTIEYQWKSWILPITQFKDLDIVGIEKWVSLQRFPPMIKPLEQSRTTFPIEDQMFSLTDSREFRGRSSSLVSRYEFMNANDYIRWVNFAWVWYQ